MNKQDAWTVKEYREAVLDGNQYMATRIYRANSDLRAAFKEAYRLIPADKRRTAMGRKRR